MRGSGEMTPRSLEAIAQLPPQLRPAVMSEADQLALLWLGTTVDQAGGLVVFEAVLRVIKGGTPSRIGPEQGQELETTLSRFGFGLAPDPCCSLFSSTPQDRVVLFRLPEPNESVMVPSNAYRKGLLFLTLGLMSMAQSGTDFARQADQLSQFVDQLAGLSEAERVCLAANHLWHQQNLDRLQQLRLQLSSIDQKQRLRLALTATRLPVDDALGNPELGHISGRIFDTLGLELPQPPQEHTSDDRAETIGSKRESSRRPELPSLSTQIGQIEMGGSNRDGPTHSGAAESDASRPAELVGVTSAIQQRRLLSALMARRTWPRVEFDALVDSFGLKPADAIEALNEWALDQYDDLLIKGDDPIQINNEPGVEYLQAV